MSGKIGRTFWRAAVFAALPAFALAQTAPAAPAATQTPATQTAIPPVAAPEPPLVSLSDQIAAILASPAVARDHWGIIVTALDGTPIYSLNEAQLFQPASNAKLFTTAAALALLGPTRTFQTAVAITGPIKKGSLHGDLYLVGGGDANFGSNDVPYISPAFRPKSSSPPPADISDIENLADQIVAKGIHKIEGNIVGDDSLYQWRPYPPDWSWDDLVWGYGAPVSALTIHDNEIQIKVAPGDATIVPDVPYYTISNQLTFISGGKRDCDSIRFSVTPGSKELLVEGVRQETDPPCAATLAINDPAEYAALALKTALQARGVQIDGSEKVLHDRLPMLGRSPISIQALSGSYGAPNLITKGCMEVVNDGPNVTVIADHTSPPLSADVLYTNKVSQNLHAEILLRNLAQFDCDSSAAYPRVVRQWLINAGIDPNDFVFYDGSGLSSHDLVTPRAIAKLLAYAANNPHTHQPQPWFAVWKSSLPVGGEDGSLASRFAQPPLKDHVFAKTGTLGEARALSGYLDCASGRSVIFSILVDNHLPGTTDDRDAMDQIVAAIQSAE